MQWKKRKRTAYKVVPAGTLLVSRARVLIDPKPRPQEQAIIRAIHLQQLRDAGLI